MFFQKLLNIKKDRKLKVRPVDQITEQVRRLLESEDQKLILMVRQ